MTITVFNNITVEIPDEQADYLIKYGNGGVSAITYEVLLRNAGITPSTCGENFVKQEVLKLVSEEVQAAEIINDMWDKGEL